MATVKKWEGNDVPEGATHYSPSGINGKGTFYKLSDDESEVKYYWCFASLSDHYWSLADRGLGNDLIELPQEPEQFVPKVGEACEYTAINSHNGEYSAVEAGRWYECKEIIAFHGGFVWTSDNGLRLLSNTLFRPIKTEREKVIEWAVKEWKREDYPAIGNFFGSMYDLGALTLPESK